MLDNPEIKIGLSAAREVGEDILLANDTDEGPVYIVIPACDGLFPGNLTLVILSHKIAMGLNVIQQAVVQPRHRKTDIGIGAQGF